MSLSPLRFRVLHAIPPTEAIDTVQVLPSRTEPQFVTWKGGAVRLHLFASFIFLPLLILCIYVLKFETDIGNSGLWEGGLD